MTKCPTPKQQQKYPTRRSSAVGMPSHHRRPLSADPWRQASLRWFDGAQWTGYTHDVEVKPFPLDFFTPRAEIAEFGGLVILRRIR
jgi:hypothetical protein